jgi:hypothetical protein
MTRKRIFITVKTYPTISQKYAELVCTAGILEDGSWVRIYPLPFRRLDFNKRFSKYTWIEIDVERNTNDFRPETYRIVNLDTLKTEDPPRLTPYQWEVRKQIIFKNKKIYTNIDEIIALAKNKEIKTSLAVFKPKEIIDFVVEPAAREWDKIKTDALEAESRQLTLFQTAEDVLDEFRLVTKVPYKFSYQFIDAIDKKHTLMIEDWEIGMLYFNCLRQENGNEEKAIEKVKNKYFNELLKRDLYLFLGTTKEFHFRSPNPFIIIGVFYPPKGDQGDLFGGEE